MSDMEWAFALTGGAIVLALVSFVIASRRAERDRKLRETTFGRQAEPKTDNDFSSPIGTFRPIPRGPVGPNPYLKPTPPAPAKSATATPTVTKDDDGVSTSVLVTGMLLQNEMMNSPRQEDYPGDLTHQPTPHTEPVFVAGGGSSEGAGASSTWSNHDTPSHSETSSSYSSPSDSGSSSDSSSSSSSSSDSGSSSGGGD